MSSTALHEGRQSALPRDLVLVVAAGRARGRRMRLGARARIGSRSDADLVVPEMGADEIELTRSERGVSVKNALSGKPLAEVLDDAATLGTLRVVHAGGCPVHLRAELVQSRMAPGSESRFDDLVGASPGMRALFAVLREVAPSLARVLIEGEPGTGKASIARAIHRQSGRSAAPLVVADCGLVGCDVLERELFGDAARGGEDGALSAATGGTLLLCEVDEIPLDLQPRLLDALRSLGSSVRVLSTAHRNLELEVERGKFDPELLLELAVVPVAVPPLRSRREDVPVLVEQFVDQARRMGADVALLDARVIAALAAHDWPGNVGELAGVVTRFLEHGGDETLPLPVPSPAEAEPMTGFDPGSTYRETRGAFEASFERRYIRWLLLRHRGNISAAAREAKMDRKHLYDLARKHGLRGERPSSAPPSSQAR